MVSKNGVPSGSMALLYSVEQGRHCNNNQFNLQDELVESSECVHNANYCDVTQPSGLLLLLLSLGRILRRRHNLSQMLTHNQSYAFDCCFLSMIFSWKQILNSSAEKRCCTGGQPILPDEMFGYKFCEFYTASIMVWKGLLSSLHFIY